jgi:phosphoserine phosphatase
MFTESGERASSQALKLVVFDMDGVVVDHVSSWAVVHEALGTDNSQALHDFMDGRIDDFEFIRRDVALWRSKRPDLTMEDLVQILEGAPRMGGTAQAVAALRAQGTQCAIVSGGLRPLADLIAREAGLGPVRANGVPFGPDGRLTDGALVEVPLRNKAQVVEALQAQMGVTREQTGSVGDSPFDEGLFRRSSISVAFNPLDEGVARAATHTVRSKDLRAAVAPLLDGARFAR